MSRRRSHLPARVPMKYRLALRKSRALADGIIAEHQLNPRMRKTLPVFILAEALDLRTAKLRRVVGHRRAACGMIRLRWAERCEENPALERSIYDAAAIVREEAGQ
jgi:hypothetical protein